MNRFYNPYQFIPVTGRIDGDSATHRCEFSEIAAGPARHDLWHRQGHSGRIVCGLRLETPTVVGARQEGQPRDPAKLVRQYHWRGQPAIPANSLKGMISSLAETLSQSTLRVLDNRKIFLRVPDDTKARSKRVELPLTAHDYFGHIDPDLPPWNKDRGRLTPAECLFGVVEVNEQDANPDPGRNLAGRLSFHDALPAAESVDFLPETLLRVLNSPKLPCPSMYFHLKGYRGQWIAKRDLYDRIGRLRIGSKRHSKGSGPPRGSTRKTDSSSPNRWPRP